MQKILILLLLLSAPVWAKTWTLDNGATVEVADSFAELLRTDSMLMLQDGDLMLSLETTPLKAGSAKEAFEQALEASKQFAAIKRVVVAGAVGSFLGTPLEKAEPDGRTAVLSVYTELHEYSISFMDSRSPADDEKFQAWIETVVSALRLK
jgi:hypothetical protein